MMMMCMRFDWIICDCVGCGHKIQMGSIVYSLFLPQSRYLPSLQAIPSAFPHLLCIFIYRFLLSTRAHLYSYIHKMRMKKKNKNTKKMQKNCRLCYQLYCWCWWSWWWVDREKGGWPTNIWLFPSFLHTRINWLDADTKSTMINRLQICRCKMLRLSEYETRYSCNWDYVPFANAWQFFCVCPNLQLLFSHSFLSESAIYIYILCFVFFFFCKHINWKPQCNLCSL